MTVKKLSDSNKNEILKLYRETGETTSTLAERYDVSNSTISRFLKSTLQEEEYEELIQQKRAARTFGKDTAADLPLFKPEPDVSIAELLVEAEPSVASAQELTPVAKKLRRRPAASASKLEQPTTTEVTDLTDQSVNTTDSPQLPIKVSDALSVIADTSASPISEQTDSKPVNKPKLLDTQPILKTVEPLSSPTKESVSRQEQPQSLQASGTSNVPMSLEEKAEASAIAQMFGEDLLDESEELIDIDDEDLEDEDEDEDDLDEDRPILTRRVSAATLVQVLPLSEANLPRTCYLVIDRASELITRPLRDFGELGQIPSQEVHQKTLPVFDNHRIARRFSTKRDRVIKVPDSRMLQKTRSQLEAKGITRLLVDGQVYSLSR